MKYVRSSQRSPSITRTRTQYLSILSRLIYLLSFPFAPLELDLSVKSFNNNSNHKNPCKNRNNSSSNNKNGCASRAARKLGLLDSTLCLFQVDWDELEHKLARLETECKKAMDNLRLVAKHEAYSSQNLRSSLAGFLTDSAERIAILKIVSNRMIHRLV